MSIEQKLQKLTVPGPTITSITKPFWDGVVEGKLQIQRCLDCEKHIFYPRSHCPHCWSDKIE